MRYANKRGQAIVEMAIFGSLILLLFGVLLSHLQRLNDQQYVQMEAFRRALLKGCTYQGKDTDGAGASVQLTSLQNRRLIDLSGNFKKGSPATVSGGSSVFWAVPKAGSQPENMIIYRVNDDESPDLSSKQNERVEGINYGSDTVFDETMVKQESPQDIATQRASQLTDTVTTTLVNKDGNTVWEVTQGAYKDSSGQIKYSSQAVGAQIDNSRTWRTDFNE